LRCSSTLYGVDNGERPDRGCFRLAFLNFGLFYAYIDNQTLQRHCRWADMHLRESFLTHLSSLQTGILTASARGYQPLLPAPSDDFPITQSLPPPRTYRVRKRR